MSKRKARAEAKPARKGAKPARRAASPRPGGKPSKPAAGPAGGRPAKKPAGIPSQRGELAELRRELAALRREHDAAMLREQELRRLLEVDSRSKKGDRTVVREMLDRIDSLEGYLLNNTKRIENILSALKTHRDYLIKLNRKAFAATPRDVMRAELAIMGNTLGILALNGVRVSEELFRDIRKLEVDMRSEDAKIGELQRRKDELDLRFKAEVGQHDVEEIFSDRKEVYGYR